VIFELLSTFAAGYFVGGVPVAAIAARLAGHDIFRVGSGNMGAMNAARNLGWALGAAVFLLDVLKGAAAALLGGWMGQAAGLDASFATSLAAGVGAVAGHAWSPYVRFRGGKALATAFGMTLPVVPWAGVAGLTLMVALVLLLRRATLAAMLALTLYPPLTGAVLLRAGRPEEEAFTAVTAAILIAVISLIKHVQALRRPDA
jgi:glycerol-3-phosphate acyltransferase PlsY